MAIRNLTTLTAVGILLTASAARAGRKPPPAAPPPPQPAIRIEVAPLGYVPPGSFYLTYRLSSAAMGFLDDDHLLFTFRVGGLLKRLPSDQLDDDDQEIRALVLNLHTGRVVKQTQWREHDRSAYLWPYQNGQFLVRVRDSLFLTDASLELRPFLTLSAGLRYVQISPDRKLTVLETDEPEKAQPVIDDTRALGSGTPMKVMILRSGTSAEVTETHARGVTQVPLLGAGLLDTLEGTKLDTWVVRWVPFQGQPRILTEVKTDCRPTPTAVSATVTLITGCYLDGDDHRVAAVSADGQELWQARWQNKYVWGWFTSAENGSRFVYESLEVNRPISTFDALYPEDVQAQLAGVYDTLTGKVVLVKNATPVLSAGQNVALSPDGMRFAILRDGALEIYDLPPVEKQPQLSSAKSARPGE
ncbi:MAG TPA: hypothetical protein VHU89_06030 [Acidobacteriaceae bacterium]|nr:hypothetical protein [Acidobacteriaceae bacterium]